VNYEVEVNGRMRHVTVHRADGRFTVTVDGRAWTVDAARVDAHTLSLLVGPASHEVTLAADGAPGQFVAGVGGVPVAVSINSRKRGGRRADGRVGGGPERLVAPMPGKIVRVLTTVGAAVQARQPLIVVEAMKMENELRASRPGIVSELLVREGQSVDAGTPLLVVVAE
jgi:biotin carboxyl carrier protein